MSKEALDTQSGEDSFIPIGDFFVEPRGDLQFTKDIIVLTSGMTASAAENFTLMMMPFPYVTIIGEITSGAFSDVLNRTLPNGWEFGLSNERFFSSEGIDYQKIGITPDIAIPLSAADLAVGKDSILDAALSLLGAAPSVAPSVPSAETIVEVDPQMMLMWANMSSLQKLLSGLRERMTAFSLKLQDSLRSRFIRNLKLSISQMCRMYTSPSSRMSRVR